MKVSIALCLAVCVCVHGGVVPLATHLVRTPQHDSAVITSDRIGGNFAYSTKEAHAYAAISPIVQQVVSPVAVSYSAHPVAYAHPQPVVYTHPQQVLYAHQQPLVYAQQPLLVPQPIAVPNPGLAAIGVSNGLIPILGAPVDAAAPAAPEAQPATEAAPEAAPEAAAPAETASEVQSDDSVSIDSA